MAMIDQALVEHEPQILQLRVYNFNTFDITDKFDGTTFTVPAAGYIDVPVDAAFHIFGWHKDVDPEAMKRHCQKRFGWNTPAMMESNRADMFWSQLRFKPIAYRMVPEEVEDDAPEPVDPVTQAQARKPRQNPVMRAADEAQARHA